MEVNALSNSTGKISTEDTLMGHFKAMMFGNGEMKANVSSNTQSAFNNILQDSLGKNTMRREVGREQSASRSFDNRRDVQERSKVETRENDAVRNLGQEKNTQKKNKTSVVEKEGKVENKTKDNAKDVEKTEKTEKTENTEKTEKTEENKTEQKDKEDNVLMVLGNVLNVDMQEVLQLVQDEGIDILKVIENQDEGVIEQLVLEFLGEESLKKADLKEVSQGLIKLLSVVDEQVTKKQAVEDLHQDNKQEGNDLEKLEIKEEIKAETKDEPLEKTKNSLAETMKVVAPQIKKIKEIISNISKEDLELNEDVEFNLDEYQENEKNIKDMTKEVKVVDEKEHANDNEIDSYEVSDEENLYQQAFKDVKNGERVESKGVSTSTKSIEYDVSVSNTNTEKAETTKTTFKISKPNASFKENLVKELVDKAKLTISKGKNEMELKLKPEQLGKLSMKIATEEDGVIGRITVENDVVKQVIEANLNTLKDSLQQQGIKVQGFQVDVGGNPQKGHERDKDKDRHNNNSDNGQNAKSAIGKITNAKIKNIRAMEYQGYDLPNSMLSAYKSGEGGVDLTA